VSVDQMFIVQTGRSTTGSKSNSCKCQYVGAGLPVVQMFVVQHFRAGLSVGQMLVVHIVTRRTVSRSNVYIANM